MSNYGSGTVSDISIKYQLPIDCIWIVESIFTQNKLFQPLQAESTCTPLMLCGRLAGKHIVPILLALFSSLSLYLFKLTLQTCVLKMSAHGHGETSDQFSRRYEQNSFCIKSRDFAELLNHVNKQGLQVSHLSTSFSLFTSKVPNSRYET